MKTIGILGGMSATSTQLYYKILCDLSLERLGGLHSPELLIRSVDFDPIATWMEDGEWERIGALLNREAIKLQKGGAEILVLATNTMHKLMDQVMESVDIPLVHIADATAAAVKERGFKSPAFFATKFTMEGRFYLDRLEASGLNPIVPNSQERLEINRVIFDELCRNEVNHQSERYFVDVVKRLVGEGADSVVLGCTEVCLLLNDQNTSLPTFDSTNIHCQAALEVALG